MLRGKKGDEIFDKVVAIPGDVSEIGLGLSPQHRKLITEEAEFIYHTAATVRFDEPLKKAVLLNTRGTREMCLLAMDCKKLNVCMNFL